MALSYKEDVSGFIFMCNHETKLDCYRYRVFGLPEWRLKDVEKIRPGTSLFLFDCDTRLLYGTYTATSSGSLGIEESAFGGKFPAQVKFKIHQDCLPLPETCFKHAILDNYQKVGHKFSPELSLGQVKTLLSLFHPISINEQVNTPTSAPALSMQYQTYSAGNGSIRQYRPYQYNRPDGHSWMNVGTIHGPSSQHSLHNYQINLNPQPDFSSSMAYMGGSYAQSLPNSQQTYVQYPQYVAVGSNQAQSISDPQYLHQNVLNSLPNFSHYLNMVYANFINQSHASSLSNVPHHSDQAGAENTREPATVASDPYQGVVAATSSGAVERIMYGDQGDQQ